MFEQAIKQYLEKHGFESFQPKAVLFDMDGVIYDSMPNHAKAWNRSMAAYGLDMSEHDAYLFEGMRGMETIKVLAKKQWNRELSDEEANSMYKAKSDYFSSCPKAQKMKGVEELMGKIKADGLTIGVVTGSGQHSLLDNLEKEFPGLLQKKYMVTCFDVNKGKPEPYPYLMGLEKCGGLQPWEAIVVENAPLGVRAAQAARIFTIVVNTGPLPDKVLADEGADLIFSSMTDLCDSWEAYHSSVSSP